MRIGRPTQIAIAILTLCLCAISCSSNKADDAENYKILHRIIMQPVDHSEPGGPKLGQRVDILIPDGAPIDSPVFFNLGNETDATDDHLREFHTSHGERNDIIYVQAEHRGYGQSLTDEQDQSVPSYIRIDQVLADTHEVVSQMKKEYPGPWMAAGWSYGGGLVIDYAHKYPEDIAVVMASSGVVDWPFMDYGYDRQVRETLGDACYDRLAKHAGNLEPEKPFDRNWLERELLYATAQGVVQYPNLKKFQPAFKLLTYLPTPTFVKALHRMDDMFGDGEAWRYARATGAKDVGPAEIEEGLHNWHAWRYQMCAEIGGFITSETSADGAIFFTRDRDDCIEECREQFGEEPLAATSPEWSQRAMTAELEVPLVYVTGGMDPWLSVSLEPEYKIKNGKYFFAPEGRHCPERADHALAQQVLEEMLKYARAD
jgi:pimeloyl-ACP methyl ester carboxylesterase